MLYFKVVIVNDSKSGLFFKIFNWLLNFVGGVFFKFLGIKRVFVIMVIILRNVIF